MERNPWGGVVLLILVVVIVVIYRWHHKHNVVGAMVIEKPTDASVAYEPYATEPLSKGGKVYLKRSYHGEKLLPIQIDLVWTNPVPAAAKQIKQQEAMLLASSKDLLDKFFAPLGEVPDGANKSSDGEAQPSGSALINIINIEPELAVRIKVIDPHNHEKPKVLTNTAWQNLLNPPCR